MPFFRKRVLALLMAIQGMVYSHAQTSELPVFKEVSHPFMPTITSEYFYFSRDGLIWFSTIRGLTSFDGSEIVYYSTPEQAESFRLSNITTMAEDAAGTLYIGTESRVYSFNRRSKEFTALPLLYPVSRSDLNTKIRNLYLDNGRFLYIGFSSIGMQVFDLLTKKIERYQPSNKPIDSCKCDLLQLNTVSSFTPHFSKPSLLWIGTFNGIYLFDKVTKTFSRRFQVENPMVNIYRKDSFNIDIRKMDTPDDSTIWFTTSTNGFGRYNTSTGHVRLFLHDGRLKTNVIWKSYIFRSFARWTPGKYIIGINDPHPGLFDTRTLVNTPLPITHDKNTNDGIQYTTSDNLGNVWMLNNGKLYATIPSQFRLRVVDIEKQNTPDYLPNQLGKICYDAATKKFYAAVAFSSGVYVLDSSMQIQRIIPAPLFTNKWTYRETCTEVIAIDGSNRIWTTGMETYIYSPKTDRFEYADKLYPGLRWIRTKGECLDMLTTREGNLVMRFMEGPLYVINHRDLSTDTIHLPNAPRQNTFEIGTKKVMYDTVHNKMYLNNASLMVQYDIQTHAMRELTGDILFGGQIETSREVVDYALDDEGRVWLWIPSYGLRILDPESLSCIDSIPIGKKGLLSGNYQYIRNGGPSFMYMIGGEGIVMYNFREQQSWLLGYSNGIAGPLPYYLGNCQHYLFANENNRILYYDMRDFSKLNFSKTPVLNTITANDSLIYLRNDDRAAASINLKYFENNLSFSFSAQEFFFPERVEYAYQLSDIDRDWHYTHSINRHINYTRLPPGHYMLRLKAQIQGGNWQGPAVEYSITIQPAFWQTGWFKLICITLATITIVALVKKRIESIRRTEQQRLQQEKRLLELEARALRAQMNPHFIFNSLNSIKSLINKNENEKAAQYLTTFSKLIRTLFQNSDRREISLFEEIETCKLYTQIEKMRFGDKVDFIFEIDPAIDLKDIKVPALILQPFIENAIWHGLVPKESGGTVLVSVRNKDGAIECVIDDNGVGRKLSRQYSSQYETGHESKGISLTQSRLKLDKLLNDREDSIAVIDKSDEQGRSNGTRILINFKENNV